MNVNVFNYSLRPAYYLRHPIRFLKETFNNFKAAWMRATKGYCYQDIWNLDHYFLTVLPQMMRHMADYGSAYPDTDYFPTPESWNNWLHVMADRIDFVRDEENWEKQNEYQEDFERILEQNQNKSYNGKWITVSYGFTDEEQKEIMEKYRKREIQLSEMRQNELENIFKTLSKQWFCLWD